MSNVHVDSRSRNITNHSQVDLPASSHDVKHLDASNVGDVVTLHGYLGSRVDVSKAISFVPLFSSDLSHVVQLVSNVKSSDEADQAYHSLLRSCKEHVPVVVKGTVQQKVKPKYPPRASEVNRNEDVEINISELQILNDFAQAGFLQEDSVLPPELRHLQLRQSKNLRDALAFRAKAVSICRSCLTDELGFLEVETPLLFKSTPEGAREFLVPTRTPGKAYALPQSPQQFKQILMASGVPKYFQVVKCFRDEDLRADRQPEFTQFDMEMSFATGEDVVKCIERLIRQLWAKALDFDLDQQPFPRLSYEESMLKYGIDKPDTRIGMEIAHYSSDLYMDQVPVDLASKVGAPDYPIFEAFKLSVAEEPAESQSFVNDFMDSPEAQPFLKNDEGQPAIFVYNSRIPLGGLQPLGFSFAAKVTDDLDVDEGDVIVLQTRRRGPLSGGSTPIGNLRLAMHRAAVAASYQERPQGWNFLWINKFPLFSPINASEPGQGGSAGLASTHHPFTAPASAHDLELLASEPQKAVADHYDLVLNGVELGGGSRRIHNADLQEYVMRDVLKMSDERIKDFSHLIDALKTGCPPHAGIALGLDRLIATMLGKDSIRDVIAFPKTGKGEDAMMKSPAVITQGQLDTYHLKLK